MKFRTLLIGSLIVSTLAIGLGAASAQANPPLESAGDVRQAVIDLAVEQTGLEPGAILQQLRAGSSLADLITANGGDVDQFVADATDLVTERINQAVADGTIRQQRADRLLGNLESTITTAVNRKFGGPPVGQPVRNAAAAVLMDTISQATGLQPGDILSQWRNGGTLADVITVNGGNPEQIVSDAVATATAAINARVDAGQLTRDRADQLIEQVSNGFEAALQREAPQASVAQRIERYVLAQAAEQTGLTAEEILRQIQDGSSLASVLEANGVDTGAFIDGLMATAEARTNTRLAQLRTGLTNRINQPEGGN